MSSDLDLPVTQVAEVEYSEEEQMAWDYFVRYRWSYRKIATEMSKDLGRHVPHSTVGLWIKKRTDRENAMREVLHLFNEARSRLLAGYALDFLYGDCAHAVRIDGSRLEKLGRLMLDIIKTQIDLHGLTSTRISIEDARSSPITQYSYQELADFAELDAANNTKFDTIKGRNHK